MWREWVIENDTITGMQFVMGEKCGSSDREATVSVHGHVHVYCVFVCFMHMY